MKTSEDNTNINEDDGYASSEWELRENIKPRFHIPDQPSSLPMDGANIAEDSCHIAEENCYASEDDGFASSDWELREKLECQTVVSHSRSAISITNQWCQH
ncbi:hypothetical protein H4Q26_010025 [Puccinia striiformis f. sp. tritici PST-130]|nr:hypothetical protein H4Q26_010025 [Puccinia striiformis f. sp. tritici PST-130]